LEPRLDADEGRARINETTHAIIGAAHKVSNDLGCGFLEKVYENALSHVLRKTGFAVEQQSAIEVWYDGVVVGLYVADMVVDDSVLVELKVSTAVDEIHLAQCLNYLKATGMTVCLLLNFGLPKVDVKRIVNSL
jgi:GxxExxY protein